MGLLLFIYFADKRPRSVCQFWAKGELILVQCLLLVLIVLLASQSLISKSFDRVLFKYQKLQYLRLIDHFCLLRKFWSVFLVTGHISNLIRFRMEQEYQFPGGGNKQQETENDGGADASLTQVPGSNGHDRNLSLPSNTTLQREVSGKSRPMRAATYSRPNFRKASKPSVATSENNWQQPSPPPTIPQGLAINTTMANTATYPKATAVSTPTSGEFDVTAQRSVSGPASSAATTATATANTTKPQQKSSDPKTPSEYALHILFTQVSFCCVKFVLHGNTNPCVLSSLLDMQNEN